MSSLPPEIITNLLTRLPVKSLLRFRCVCKPWCAEIDSPDFIKLHLTHSITTGSNIFPIARHESTLYSFDSDSLENLGKIETPFINLLSLMSFSTCNGLLLVKAPATLLDYGVKVILFNPSTRKHLISPTPPLNKDADLDTLIRSTCLGYDAINDDYKVFDILVFRDEAKNFSISCETRVYSLKYNEWHIAKDFPAEIMFIGTDLDAYVNGALHAYSRKDRIIVALDVAKETFYLLPMPNFGGEGLSFTWVHVFDGHLAMLCRYSSDNRFDIWVMKEYGVKESWSMILSVKPEKDNVGTMLPMVYSRSRTEVLLNYDGEQLVWYDLRKKTFRGFQANALPVKFCPFVCVESLVSFGGTEKIKEKKNQHGEEEMKVELSRKIGMISFQRGDSS